MISQVEKAGIESLNCSRIKDTLVKTLKLTIYEAASKNVYPRFVRLQQFRGQYCLQQSGCFMVEDILIVSRGEVLWLFLLSSKKDIVCFGNLSHVSYLFSLPHIIYILYYSPHTIRGRLISYMRSTDNNLQIILPPHVRRW